MLHSSRPPLPLALIGLLALGVVVARPALAAIAIPGHHVSAKQDRTQRDYFEGLKDLHIGRADLAARDFLSAIKREPDCAMAHWGLSRAHHRLGEGPEALAAAARAEELVAGVDDREKRLIQTWHAYLKAGSLADAEKKRAQDQVRANLDQALTLYSEDPEVWLQQAEVAENSLRSGPYTLAAILLMPDHPVSRAFRPVIPPAPTVTPPAPTQPLPPLPNAPKLFDGLGDLSYPMVTSSPEAQRYFEQGLRTLHAYVTPGRVANGAVQCFRYAAQLDPNAALPWWGISFSAFEQSPKPIEAANRALELALRAGNDKEIRMCAARVLELTNGKREEFLDALDAAILAYPRDIELWIWRGKTYGYFPGGPGNPRAIPYQLVAHRIQPTHPSPNHELVHLYEAINRPALGFPFTIGFRKSAPNMPHAQHMQAHLAMRLGRWQEAIDCTRESRKTSLAGYPELDPGHHIDILIRALAHQGRFAEAESEPRAYRDGLPWARLLQLKMDGDELERWAAQRRQRNSPDGFYIGAIVELDRGRLEAAQPFITDVENRYARQQRGENAYRRAEVKGRFLVQSGQVDEGLKLMKDAAALAVKDVGLHAWGGGGYYLEVWGETALRANRLEEAEEAYHEAIAHEHGSIRAALGMQVVWERRNRPEMAEHYARRAQEIWKNADPGSLQRQLSRIRGLASGSVASATAPVTGGSR